MVKKKNKPVSRRNKDIKFQGADTMKFTCIVISVADINAARKFYEDLFGLAVFQDCFRITVRILPLPAVWYCSRILTGL